MSALKSLAEIALIASFLVVGAWHQMQKTQGESGLNAATLHPAPPLKSTAVMVKKPSKGPSRLKIESGELNRIKNFTSLKEFLGLKMGGEARGLIEAMVDDEFESGNPFLSLASIQPLTLILSKGVESVTRSAYRSPEFLRSFGYDMVRYEITHLDQSKSLVMAYREKTENTQVGIGRDDHRPVFAYFAIAGEENQAQVSVYRNGTLEQAGQVPLEEAWTKAGQRVNQAVQMLSSR